MEDIQDDFRVAIPQHDVPSDDDAFAIGRWRGKPALQFDGNDVNLSLQVRRELGTNHKPPLLSGGQPIFLGETRREAPVIFAVPAPKFVAVMAGESVAATILIVVIVSMSIPVPPMPVVAVLVAIPIMLVFICKSCVCRHEKKSKDNGGNPFSSFQRFLQEGVG
jgi:hypothetical protein